VPVSSQVKRALLAALDGQSVEVRMALALFEDEELESLRELIQNEQYRRIYNGAHGRDVTVADVFGGGGGGAVTFYHPMRVVKTPGTSVGDRPSYRSHCTRCDSYSSRYWDPVDAPTHHSVEYES